MILCLLCVFSMYLPEVIVKTACRTSDLLSLTCKHCGHSSLDTQEADKPCCRSAEPGTASAPPRSPSRWPPGRRRWPSSRCSPCCHSPATADDQSVKHSGEPSGEPTRGEWGATCRSPGMMSDSSWWSGSLAIRSMALVCILMADKLMG